MKKNRSLLRSSGFQSFLASLLCILGGLLLGYIVLLLIEPSGAWEAIVAVVKNFFRYPEALRAKYLGQTLVKMVPLLMCALSVLFAYKVGMFNIGAAGQYVAGACASLYFALGLNMPWWICLLAGIAAGALLGVISGALRSYCNVNVVISGIMLNWIGLYLTNLILTTVKNPNSPYTKALNTVNNSAILPQMGLNKLFGGEKTVTIAIPLAIIACILVWIVLSKTKFGYELKATGCNLHAAKSCGMKENRNIILTMAIAGGLAGLGAGLFYLTGIQEWEVTVSSVPGMGFNGIAVAFLGGLHPLGAIPAAYFIQHITSGGGNVNLQVYSSQISDLISALIIYLCAFVPFVKGLMQNSIRKRDERKLTKANANEEGGAE